MRARLGDTRARLHEDRRVGRVDRGLAWIGAVWRYMPAIATIAFASEGGATFIARLWVARGWLDVVTPAAISVAWVVAVVTFSTALVAMVVEIRDRARMQGRAEVARIALSHLVGTGRTVAPEDAHTRATGTVYVMTAIRDSGGRWGTE